jgi:integrase
MPYDEMPSFMAALRAEMITAAAALEWTILSAVRSDNTFGMVWPEIDVDKKIWTIPAQRMKAESDHRVPLTDRMIEILEGRSRDTKFVFSGENPKKKLPHEKMLKVLKTLRPGVTVHGCRTSFRTWAGEETSFAREILEKALAHTVGDETERAYDRGDLFEKRRKLMNAWARYCASTPRAARTSNVVVLRGSTS